MRCGLRAKEIDVTVPVPTVRLADFRPHPQLLRQDPAVAFELNLYRDYFYFSFSKSHKITIYKPTLLFIAARSILRAN